MEEQRDEKLWQMAKRRAAFQRSLAAYFIINGFFVGAMVVYCRAAWYKPRYTLANMEYPGLGNRYHFSIHERLWRRPKRAD